MGLRKGVYVGFYAPAELKRALQERATKEHRSLSQECIHILEAAVKDGAGAHSKSAGEYKGRTVYRSLRQHMEHVGGTMHLIDEGLYFTSAHRPPSDTDFPGNHGSILVAGKSLDEVKRGVDEWEGVRS